MRVKDFMITDVISVRPETSLKDVMKTFVEKKIGGMPIVDKDGKLQGIVTDGDLLRAIKPIDSQIQNYFTYMMYIEEVNLESRLSDMADQPIINVAKTSGIVTIKSEDPLKKVIQLLAKHHFKKLPVIDEKNHVIGIISRGDVIRNIQTNLLNNMM